MRTIKASEITTGMSVRDYDGSFRKVVRVEIKGDTVMCHMKDGGRVGCDVSESVTVK